MWTHLLDLVICFCTTVESQNPVHPLSTVRPQEPTGLSTAVKGVMSDMKCVLCDVSESVFVVADADMAP